MTRPSEHTSEGAARSDRERISRLCSWYAAAARDLPWRRTSDPYAIWISEAMLQQTQAARVAPYWERFLARYPDVGSLAEAEDRELLALWSGLGYYARARRLREAARAMCARYGGQLPRTRARLLELPGFGPYTAGAVASIAFGERAPLVDGNVARVLARLFAIEHEPSSGPGKRALWAHAERLVAHTGRGPRGPGVWNQALMELGATVCTPREPSCGSCVLFDGCAARSAGRQGELPRRKPRAKPVQVRLEVLLVEERGRLLLERRPAGGRMAGLLELPTRELVARGAQPHLWPARFAHRELRAGPELGRARHGITVHRIEAVLRAGRPLAPGVLEDDGRFRWVPSGAWGDLELTGLTRKLLAP